MTYEHKKTLSVKRIGSWDDMPDKATPCAYIVGEGADEKTVTLQKGPRQFLEAMLQAPVACASPVRLSTLASTLRRAGFCIETVPIDGRSGQSGAYVLHSSVQPA